MIIAEPTEITLKLMSNELELIIDELERLPHNYWTYLGIEKIVNKLKKSLKSRGIKK